MGIRAAGLLWDQMQDHKRPYVRQCLTFAEIAKSRNEDRRQTDEVIEAQAKHGNGPFRISADDGYAQSSSQFFSPDLIDSALLHSL